MPFGSSSFSKSLIGGIQFSKEIGLAPPNQASKKIKSGFLFDYYAIVSEKL